jgi:lysophospholipase L1-like esterase
MKKKQFKKGKRGKKINLQEKNTDLERIQYTAIGDSLTAGVGSRPSTGFVQRYRNLGEASLNTQIISQVYARPGATTGEVLRMVKHPILQRAIQDSSIITISAGGNDLIQAARAFLRTQDKSIFENALIRCKESMSNILGEIDKLNEDKERASIVRIVDLYNPLTDIEPAENWVTLFNSHLQSFTDENTAVTNINTAFKGNENELLSFDRIHPNSKGYQVIAEELDELGYNLLVF